MRDDDLPRCVPAPFDEEPTEVDLLAQAPMGALVGDAAASDGSAGLPAPDASVSDPAASSSAGEMAASSSASHVAASSSASHPAASVSDSAASSSASHLAASSSASSTQELPERGIVKSSSRVLWPLLSAAWFACAVFLGRLAPLVTTFLR